jgi:hypothetical protein
VSPLSRRRLSWALSGVLLATLAGDSAVIARREAKPPIPRSIALAQHLLHESDATTANRATDRDAALRSLFERRADAIRRRDRRAFLAGIDPRATAYRMEQLEVFDNLAKLDLASWTYSVQDGESYTPTQIPWQRYTGVDDLWLPVLTLRYQLAGFDEKPVGRREVYTTVRRGGRWYVANDRDLDATTSSGTSVRVEPWENGPIVVSHSKHGLVIGHPQDAKAVAGIVKEVESAVVHVSSLVGRGWGEKVVVILPADAKELDRILESPDVPYDFAAVARPLSTEPGENEFRDFAGSRVVINPDGFKVGEPFTRILIRHEMTHVATFARTGPLSPKWLIEGLAEYVGNIGSSITTESLGAPLGKLVDDKGVPGYLPSDSDFGIINDAGIGYNSGWLLCRYIASHYGRAKLLAFYDEMGNLDGLLSPGTKLEKALRKVLHTTEAALLRDWRPYVRAAVGDLTKVLVPPGGAYREDDRVEVDDADIASEKSLPVAKVRGAGIERAAEGFWYLGAAKTPSRLLVSSLVVAKDEASAVAAERLLASRYTPYDGRGRPTPHGRLYFVGVRIGGRHYNEVVAILRTGIVVVEVRVAVPGTGDPTAEATRMAAKQYAAAVKV